jgi:DNA-binding XRE family transcriptional regulator
METFGHRMKHLRKAKGFTQETFAEAMELGKRPQTIASWESDRTEPSFKDLMAISDLLGCTIDYLVKGTAMQQNVEVHNMVPAEVHRRVINEMGDLKITVKTLSHLLGKPLDTLKTAGNWFVNFDSEYPFDVPEMQQCVV